MAGRSKDPTFLHYDAHQASTYAEERSSYPVPLYNTLLDFHAKSGGQFGSLLDVGCGHGAATRDLAVHFDKTVGVDPSPEMVNVARKIGGKSKESDVRFEVSGAEDCKGAVDSETKDFDMIISAMAAHWFDMGRFWETAASLLKPNGTVGLWTMSSLYCHPSTHNASEVQKILFHLEREILDPHELPGNRVSRDMYDNLPLPWQTSPTVPAFPPALFERVEWNRDGSVDGNGEFLGGNQATTLENLEKGLATASMVTRWRDAHPELVGTPQDCVSQTISALREALEGNESFVNGASTTLLMFKKRIG
ncbi:MAG: hypothetical protein M1819_004023 [Sarea resinae]|nr:MAG: hypothetical protein M1819_004023 [Sarea resinae]